MDDRVEKFVDHRASRRSTNSAKQYRRAARVFDEYLESSGNSMESLGVTSLDDFVRWLIRKGYKPRTVANYTCIARLYCDYLRARGTSIPIFERPLMPKVSPSKPTVLPDKLIPSYLAACVRVTGDPHRTALMLLPMTGLRVTEMCTLELVNVEFMAPSEGFPRGAAQIHVTGKGGKERKVPVLPQGVPVLASYMQTVRPNLGGRSQWLFPGRNGRDPIRRQQINNRLDRIQDLLRIKKLYPHLLRHTYATLLNERGIQGFDLAAILGHADVKTTGIYVHPDNRRLVDQVGHVQYDYGSEE